MLRFRFHTGSIKRLAAEENYDDRVRFDSILVRLKEFVEVIDDQIKEGFDSILVRLKVTNTSRNVT